MRQSSTQAYGSLKAWRKAHGWNLREASQFLGISLSLYAKYENRDHSPRPARAMTISVKTGVPFAILMRAA